jgi:hypothetical protein
LSWLEYAIIFIPKPGEHNKLKLPVGTKILLNRVGKPDKKEMFLQKTSFTTLIMETTCTGNYVMVMQTKSQVMKENNPSWIQAC